MCWSIIINCCLFIRFRKNQISYRLRKRRCKRIHRTYWLFKKNLLKRRNHRTLQRFLYLSRRYLHLQSLLFRYVRFWKSLTFTKEPKYLINVGLRLSRNCRCFYRLLSNWYYQKKNDDVIWKSSSINWVHQFIGMCLMDHEKWRN